FAPGGVLWVPRCVGGGSGFLGAGAALVPDDVYRLPLGEPGAGGERLVELGGAQLLADLGYQFLLQPPQIWPGRQADPLAQALVVAAQRHLQGTDGELGHGREHGLIHDFVMLNALRGTHAASAAIAQAITTLTSALHPTADNHARKPAATTATAPTRTET